MSFPFLQKGATYRDVLEPTGNLVTIRPAARPTNPDTPPLIPEPPAWHTEAACRDQPTELFFPTRGGSGQAAKRVCARCPVRVDCLEDNLLELFGIFGGMNPRERQRERVRRGVRNRKRPAECGTDAGYQAHIKLNTRPCEPCLQAHRRAQQERRHRASR